MVRRKRAQARKEGRRQRPARDRGEASPAELYAMLTGDVDAHALLLSAGHAVAMAMRYLLAPDNVDKPVVLIEPARNALIDLGAVAYDIRLAIAVKMGLPLAGPVGPPMAAGWSFAAGPDGWELSDPTGTLIARCEVAPDQALDETAWALQAATAGQVLIAYRTRVGVRVPDGVPTRLYNNQVRSADSVSPWQQGRPVPR